MALVSLPLCQSQAARDTVESDTILAKKRASIHYPEDSSVAKRMSLHFGARCRSLSESWAFANPSTVAAPAQYGPSGATASTLSKAEVEDQELLQRLEKFLRREDDIEDEDIINSCRTSNEKIKRETTTESGFFHSAGPSDKEAMTCGLVVAVRDFAYAKTHPYHLGQYPPEPAYEESDIEEDEMDEYEEVEHGWVDSERVQEDRTQGQARGLYDFDAENSSELSFREGEFLWIHCRQFPGWFLGEMGGNQGLVPENYVQLL
ncbi:HOG (high osmolarity glycerol) pathway protein [Mortierella polycephala]|uniref:HOG (High osmolarity glycerol) pathway protein n=1 Tax=Mortierella polycephala TaxID=41804 RepID=A0A9P6QCE7_9FUNG|nr:HOG (high osmolarity glycerol) pathway protein [Mortierella polycephala]